MPDRNASRENGKRSRGPITPAGKAVSARNATKHGGYAQSIYFRNEEEKKEFNQLLEGYRSSLRPEGVWEDVQVEKLAVTDWTLMRIERCVQRDLRKRRSSYRQTGGDPSTILEN